MFLKFETPANYLIAGCSQSGKSTWIKSLIEHREELFKSPPVEIKYIYNTWQPLFDEMEKLGVQFQKELPNQEELMQWSENLSHRLLILDDVMISACASSDILTLFTVTAHHRNISSLILLQTIFPPFAFSRCLSLNSHYLVLFKAKRDRQQIMMLGMQLFPTQSEFWRASYNDATSRAYGYIFIDCHPATPSEFQLRSKIFPSEETWIYTPLIEGANLESKTVEF